MTTLRMSTVFVGTVTTDTPAGREPAPIASTVDSVLGGFGEWVIREGTDSETTQQISPDAMCLASWYWIANRSGQQIQVSFNGNQPQSLGDGKDMTWASSQPWCLNNPICYIEVTSGPNTQPADGKVLFGVGGY